MSGTPQIRTVSQKDVPCVLHDYHRPISIVNEMHHPFPQEWQKALWGEVRDQRMVSLCATGHNNVHAAIKHFIETRTWPDWCVGRTRDLANTAFVRYREAAASDREDDVALFRMELEAASDGQNDGDENDDDDEPDERVHGSS